ncbi:hypothetical protein LOD99_13223 [Oopsacas minuta]|uniref:Uncharacterized protein n=1 Tax=Oopsacas minuta TaxID=111878 RepID=A0AAV7JB92_9METZ|nr:hypothetical protein LOD99_13223 [Oopsacas minuta]
MLSHDGLLPINRRPSSPIMEEGCPFCYQYFYLADIKIHLTECEFNPENSSNSYTTDIYQNNESITSERELQIFCQSLSDCEDSSNLDYTIEDSTLTQYDLHSPPIVINFSSRQDYFDFEGVPSPPINRFCFEEYDTPKCTLYHATPPLEDSSNEGLLTVDTNPCVKHGQDSYTDISSSMMLSSSDTPTSIQPHQDLVPFNNNQSSSLLMRLLYKNSECVSPFSFDSSDDSTNCLSNALFDLKSANKSDAKSHTDSNSGNCNVFDEVSDTDTDTDTDLSYPTNIITISPPQPMRITQSTSRKRSKRISDTEDDRPLEYSSRSRSRSLECYDKTYPINSIHRSRSCSSDSGGSNSCRSSEQRNYYRQSRRDYKSSDRRSYDEFDDKFSRSCSRSSRSCSRSDRCYSKSCRPYSRSDRSYSRSDRSYGKYNRSYSKSDRSYSRYNRSYSRSDKRYSKSCRSYSRFDRSYGSIIGRIVNLIGLIAGITGRIINLIGLIVDIVELAVNTQSTDTEGHSVELAVDHLHLSLIIWKIENIFQVFKIQKIQILVTQANYSRHTLKLQIIKLE